jgi:hypothetical protein
MKFLVYLIFAFLMLTACSKACQNNEPAPCSETVPQNEACQAYFQRWFYNKSKNSCELEAYSGCTQAGFASKEECEACLCNK